MIFLLCFTLFVMASYPTVWIDLSDPSVAQQVNQLNVGFIEQQVGTKYAFHVKDLKELDQLGIPYEIHSPSRSSTEGYYSPQEVLEQLKIIAQDSSIAEYVVVGRSLQGRDIGGIRIGASVPNAQFRILGTHHGDELPSGELALHLAQYLSEHADEENIQNLLADRAIWIIPQVNPDGAAMVSRYNANLVDLNRNYNYQWSASAFRPGEHSFSEPETQAIRTLNHLENFAGGLSIHTGATNLGWVWNFTTSPSPDDDLVTHLSNEYMESCNQDSFWITNGAEWYITNGDTTDWSYGNFGVLDFTLEVSAEKIPPADRLPHIFEAHRQAILNFISWPFITTGQVVDGTTGTGIAATITIAQGWPHTSNQSGDFARMVDDSNLVNAIVTAPGYLPTEVTLDPTQRNIIELSRESISGIRPDPQLHFEAPLFSLPVEAQNVQLYRLGEESVTATNVSGQWRVDSPLPSGPWGLLIDGIHSPNALFIQSPHLPSPVSTIHEDAVHITNIEPAPGAKVRHFSGATITDLNILEVSSTAMIVEAPLEPTEGVYVFINRGEQSAFYPDRPHLSHEQDIQELYKPQGCAAASPLLLLLALSFRRERCAG